MLLLGVFFFFLLIYSQPQYKNNSTNLIYDNGWLSVPGVSPIHEGIHFQLLNQILIHQDGSEGQSNPPVNVAGKYLRVKGDFRITAVLSERDRQASLRLYAQPPIVYDQWRYEGPSISIMLVNNLITVHIWDGNSSRFMDMRMYKFASTPNMRISLEHKKDQITIIGNNHILGSMPDHAIFDSGTIWFGGDGAVGSTGWTLTGLYAQAIGNGSVDVVPAASLIVNQNDSESLRALADTNPRKLKIGTAVSFNPLFIDEEYRKLALGQFHMLTPENSMKPQFIHPQSNIYTFEEADQLVSAALKNNMTVHGHALLYDKSSPNWMTKTPIRDRKEIMREHVERVVSHFKGRVAEWDVVNEPFSQKEKMYRGGETGLEENIWFEAMGEGYIDLAFKTAHEVDPTAKLYLNDYGLENDGKRWDALLNLVKRLKQRGVPIDGIGFEAHVYTDGDYIDAKHLKKHMQILAALGLSARISEIDVTGDEELEQINQYVTALDVCLEEPNCTSYTTWGITDRYGSTTRSDRYPLVHGTSLLWDKDMKAKPAYSALQKRLQQVY